jgi:hypothetical protein
MQRKQFTEEQILHILHAAEVVENVRDVWRQHSIAEQTLSRWLFSSVQEAREARRIITYWR